MSYIWKLRLKEKKGKTTNNDNNKLGIHITLIATITSETIFLTVFFFFFLTLLMWTKPLLCVTFFLGFTKGRSFGGRFVLPVLIHHKCTFIWQQPGSEERLSLPTMPQAETALDKPEEPFWPILVRFPPSSRLSSSRTSCWLYTCWKQTCS